MKFYTSGLSSVQIQILKTTGPIAEKLGFTWEEELLFPSILATGALSIWIGLRLLSFPIQFSWRKKFKKQESILLQRR